MPSTPCWRARRVAEREKIDVQPVEVGVSIKDDLAEQNEDANDAGVAN